MKYSHILVSVLIGSIIIVGGGESGLLPYKWGLTVAGTISVVAILYYLDFDIPFLASDFSLRSNKEMVVHPNEALEWLQNEEIPKRPAYRKLNLDKTADQNMKVHTRIHKVNENGELKTKFGVVGRPLNQMDKESVAYVVHCDEGYVEYSGQLHTSEDRLNPFNGKHSWLTNAGYKARVQDESDRNRGSGVTIYQGENHRSNDVGGGEP